MHRQARERIIPLELMELERRQAIERARLAHQKPPQLTAARRCAPRRPPA